MDIRTENPFRLLKNGFMEVYLLLKKDFSSEYAIIDSVFALGFGDNGITFSRIAAKIICDKATGKKTRTRKFFLFERSQ